MGIPRRSSTQQDQEIQSRKQFEGLISSIGWKPTDVTPDLGEDFLIRIYDQGVSTGLSFYVQLKSVQNINNYQLKTGKISYPFDVADIDHWDIQIPFVFLVLWDMKDKTGWWIWICDVIGYLNQNNPNWHQQKTVNIHIPIENLLDGNGFNQIRALIANCYFPIIAKDKVLDVHAKFVFPPTQEGKAKLAEFERHIAAGDEVKLDGRYIAELEFPDWFKRIHGEFDTKSMVLQMGPAGSPLMQPAQIDFISAKYGEIRLPYVELQRVKQGVDETTISNEHQNLPFKFQIVFNVKTGIHQITTKIKYGKMDAITALQALRIQQILAHGGKIRITVLETNESDVIPCNVGAFQPPDDDFVRFIENLEKIQRITEHQIHFPEDGNFTQNDLNLAEDIASMLDTGRLHKIGEHFAVNLMKPAILQLMDIHRKGEPLRFQLSSKESNAEILRQQIKLGPVMQLATGKWDMTIEEVNSWLVKAKDDDNLQVVLSNSEIFVGFQNWVK
jgi:hypothetical protein